MVSVPLLTIEQETLQMPSASECRPKRINDQCATQLTVLYFDIFAHGCFRPASAAKISQWYHSDGMLFYTQLHLFHHVTSVYTTTAFRCVINSKIIRFYGLTAINCRWRCVARET